MLFNNKGFLLVEAMVVSAVVAITLVIIYTQFNSVYDSYEKRQSYENIDNLYITKDISDLVKEESINYFSVLLELKIDATPSVPYIDLSDCSSFINDDYCNSFVEKTNVKTILFTEYDISDLIDFDYTNEFSVELKDYIKYTNSILETTPKEGYRVIVEFNNYEYSTIKVQ